VEVGERGVLAETSFWGSDFTCCASGRSASPYSNAFVMKRLTVPRYASPISERNINCKKLAQVLVVMMTKRLTRSDSDKVKTSSLVNHPSLSLS
jgi:hypothetical protein